MFAQKLVLPIVAVLLGATAAQTASVCSQPTATINSQADASAYASCATISGSIVIGAAATEIHLDGPQQITGDLTCENNGGLVTLGSTTIGSIGGSFTLTNLTLLSTLSMSALTSVKTISWTALPALSQLTFPSTISKATSVTISNTFLSTLSGINLASVATLEVNNNRLLNSFDTQIANISSAVNINANGNSLKVTFPNLIWAANMTLRNVSSVSIPSLAVVNGSLGFYGNSFTSLAAPNLTSVGNFGTGAGSLAVVANSALQNISFPMLKSVGGAFQIANNTALGDISMPKLSTVGGAIDFSGNFTGVELPDITNIKGGFNVQSTSKIDCSAYDNNHGNGKIIQGVYTCKTTADATSISGSTGTTTGSSSSSTSSKGAAVSFGVNEAVAGLSVIGGLLQMIL